MQPSLVESSFHQDNPSWPAREPHKIFVWDPNGVYVDCCFPNPRYGHFLNPQVLKGARVVDLFSRTIGRRLKNTIHTAWKTKKHQSTELLFERAAQLYEASVTCVPTQEGRVIGFVTDRLVGEGLATRSSREVPPYDGSFPDLSLWRGNKERYSTLTPQEMKVLAVMGLHPSHEGEHGVTGNVDVVEGHVIPSPTNEDIAQQLHISVRTVKFHLTNIYRKLQITSRYQLFPPF